MTERESGGKRRQAARTGGQAFPATIIATAVLIAMSPLFVGGYSRWWEAVTVVVGGFLGLVVVRARRTRPVLKSVAAEPGIDATYPPGYLVPRELPPSPSIFVGRGTDLHRAVCHLLTTSDDHPRVVIIRGLPGMGKTSLALKIAHAVAHVYPDGQVIADLGRRDAGTEADQVAQAREYFIEALTGPGPLGPVTPEGRAGHLAALTRDRRVLFVLDDAASMDVVRELISAASHCGVIVTTRDPEAALSNKDVIIDLIGLDRHESIRVLEQIAGKDRMQAEESQAEQIADLVGGHPLSVRAAAMGLAERPHGRLAFALRRLQELRSESKEARDALDMSFALLNQEERDALRALGAVDDSFSPWMLAALTDVDERTATRIADRLTLAGFLERTSVDSVGLPLFVIPQRIHDYAAVRLVEKTDAAQRRALAAKVAARLGERRGLLPSALRRRVVVPLEEGRPIEAINSARDAIALARDAKDSVAEGLALAAFAEVRAELGIFEGAEDLARAALARRVHSDLAEAWARRTLGRLHRRLHQTDDALKEGLRRALDRCGDHVAERVRILRELAVAQAQRETGDRSDAVTTLAQATKLGAEYGFLYAGLQWAHSTVLEELGRTDESRAAIERGRAAAERNGQKLWLAWLMHREARLHLRNDKYDLARQRAFQAIEDFASMNHRYGKAHCRVVMGEAFLGEGRPDEARPLLEESVENFINCGDRWAEAEALRLLTTSYGAEPETVRLLSTAGRMFQDLGDAARHTMVERQLAVAESLG